MADSAPKNSAPILVSLCIVAIVLVTAIVAGPSVSECASSGNFGACLRQGLEQRGILPGGDSPEAVEMAASATTKSEPEKAETAPKIAAEPKMDAAPDAAATAAQSPDSQPKSALGLVRAEPDGSVVIAGSGIPGEEIEVFANGILLGTVTVEKSGDWVLVPDAPLPTGGVEISVGSTEKANQAAQSVIVVIQDDRTSEPLVVASTPGAASQILQGKTASSTDAEPAKDAMPSVGAAPQMDVASLPKEQAPSTAAQPEAATTPTVAAPAAPKPVEASPAKVMTPPSIDAIEVDGARNFFAGGGDEGATVRLYVNDQLVADSVVEGGRWLIETDKNVLTDPSQRVRLDMLQTGSSAVTARAEVNFEISLPETAVASAPAEGPKPDDNMKVASAADQAPKPAVTAPQPVADTATPSVASNGVADINAAAAENNASLLASPPAMPSPAPKPESKPAPQQSAAAPQPQTKLPVQPSAPAERPKNQNNAAAPMSAEPKTGEASAPTEPKPEPAAMAPDQKTAMATPVEAKPEAEMTEKPAEMAAPAIPTLRAQPVGDPADQRFASGNAIIRRGDNLWTIARRVYGSGLRYTAIYDANQDQIRDPALIYPGQVFDLPAVSE